MRPRLSIFIAATPRSGSWLLAEGLRDLGVAGQAEEFFRVDLDATYREQWGLTASARFAEFLGHALSAGQSPNGVFAVKIHWFQFTHLLHRLRVLHRNGRSTDARPIGDLVLLRHYFGPVRFVHLQRSDTLRQAISWQRAINTDTWWDVPGYTTGIPGGIEAYNFESIKHLFYLLEEYKIRWRDWLFAHRVEPVSVTYEHLADHYRDALVAVLAGVGLPAPDTVAAPVLRRQADGATEEWARAYAESWHGVFGNDPLGRDPLRLDSCGNYQFVR